jgi:hypothetical protein
MQATCDKQSFNSNPSLATQSQTDDEKEDKELQANRNSKSIGSQIYERQRQRVENSLAANPTVDPRPFSTLQRNPSRTNGNERLKANEIDSLREEDESSITRAHSLRNLTQKFEQLKAKNGTDNQPQANGVRPIAKRFSLLEPSVSMSTGNNLNGIGVDSHRGALDITPSKETLMEIHRKLEG